MADAQHALLFLQGLTVECRCVCHKLTHGSRGCPVCAPDCPGTVPKYPSLQADLFMVGTTTLERIDLNDLLMNAAKWGHSSFKFYAPVHKGSFVIPTWDCMISKGTGKIVKADTPIEAALVALAKAEGMEGEAE